MFTVFTIVTTGMALDIHFLVFGSNPTGAVDRAVVLSLEWKEFFELSTRLMM